MLDKWCILFPLRCRRHCQRGGRIKALEDREKDYGMLLSGSDIYSNHKLRAALDILPEFVQESRMFPPTLRLRWEHGSGPPLLKLNYFPLIDSGTIRGHWFQFCSPWWLHHVPVDCFNPILRHMALTKFNESQNRKKK